MAVKYLRIYGEAVRLAQRDERVARALDVQRILTAATPKERNRMRCEKLAADVLVDLYQRGRRMGWDGLLACVTVWVAQDQTAAQAPDAAQVFAQRMIDDGLTASDTLSMQWPTRT